MNETRHHDWNHTAPGELVGFRVVALDGAAGTVHAATWDLDTDHVVVGTRSWICGWRKVVLPSRAIELVDDDVQTVHLGMTRDQIRNAEPYHPARFHRPPSHQLLIRLR